MGEYVPGTVVVRPPASSANLGPGFDALGLALALHDEVSLTVTGGGLEVEVSGEGADEVPRDESHLLVRAARAAFAALGGQPRGLRISCVNRIPHARGLGSSSAAIVGGLVAARAAVEGGEKLLTDPELLALATRLEHHPDNVAACLLGGLTIAWMDGGIGRAVRRDPAPGLDPVVLIPEHRALTAAVRGLMPATVPHAEAAANAGRAALLVHALSGDLAMLLTATEDWLHQRYREPAMPESAALVASLRATGIPAVISGAGPTVLAFGVPGRPVPDEIEGFRVCRVAVDLAGAVAHVTVR
ncbi:MAG: homoserine kinase [Cryptosporangiaceae bacterium]|jgi:homoserine kinase|nr:homoserine kinase [Cryptosporangiaceae bacterium]